MASPGQSRKRITHTKIWKQTGDYRGKQVVCSKYSSKIFYNYHNAIVYIVKYSVSIDNQEIFDKGSVKKVNKEKGDGAGYLLMC